MISAADVRSWPKEFDLRLFGRCKKSRSLHSAAVGKTRIMERAKKSNPEPQRSPRNARRAQRKALLSKPKHGGRLQLAGGGMFGGDGVGLGMRSLAGFLARQSEVPLQNIQRVGGKFGAPFLELRLAPTS